MKLTTTRLRKMIREELSRITEMGMGMSEMGMDIASEAADLLAQMGPMSGAQLAMELGVSEDELSMAIENSPNIAGDFAMELHLADEISQKDRELNPHYRG